MDKNSNAPHTKQQAYRDRFFSITGFMEQHFSDRHRRSRRYYPARQIYAQR